MWLWYTVLFVCVGTVIFLPFAVYGKTLLWNSDGYLQYYPVLAKVKQVLTRFIQGKGISFWGWDTGIGADVIGNYALALFDPFCWLAVIFPNQYLDIAYSFIIILKLYFAGLAMLGFMDYHSKRIFVSLLTAVGYAFCTWGLIGFRQEFFLNQLILFPLLIWGTDRVADKKSPALLIISVMMSLVTSLYFSYMSALMVFVYIVLKYFLEEERKSAKNFIVVLGRYMAYVIIGSGLAAPIMLPALYTLLQASTGSAINRHILPTFKELIRFIPSFAGMITVSPNYGYQNINMLSSLMIPAIILMPRKKQISRYMFFVCAFIAIFPPAQSILNGFSYSSGRWSYALAFFFSYAAADALDYGVDKIPGYKRDARLWIGLIFCFSLFDTIIVKAMSMRDFFIITLNLFFGVIMFGYLSKEQELPKYGIHNKVFLVALANMALIPVIYNSPNLGNDMSTYMGLGESHRIYESTALRAAGSIQDPDFYRVDTVDHPDYSGGTVREAHTPANISIYWQVPSTFGYLSSLDKKWQAFNGVMANSAGTYRRTCVYSNDNRARMDFLLGVRYFLSGNASQSGYAGYGFTVKDTVDGVEIMQSEYPAGLGYVLDTAMAESDFMQYSPLEREQLLMQCVALPDEDMERIPVARAETGELDTEVLHVPSTFGDAKGNEVLGNTFTITSSAKNMVVNPAREITGSEVYLLFRNIKKEPVSAQAAWELNNKKDDTFTRPTFFSNYLSYEPYENFSIYINTKQKNIRKRLLNAAGDAQGIRGNEDFMVNLGYYDSFNEAITLNFSEIGSYTYDSVELLAVPVESYREQAAVLSKNRFTVTSKEKNNHIWGNVNTDNGGMLYLSILYNPGWKVYIDGKRADKIYHVNTAFMGVIVPAGEHEIELAYKPLGYPYTLLSTVVCAMITAGLEIYFRRKGRGESLQ
ncbi:MAG: YfhO family protein [Butyrivibrio sp.]|nr:YfhO family protein [Butyrivibrio sp.]